MKCGEKIKIVRAKHNLSQARFGQKIGMSGKSISAYETGRCAPPLRILETISNVYDTNFVQTKSSNVSIFDQKLKRIRETIDELYELLSL